MLSYSYDATPLIHQKPDAVVFPNNVEEISKIVRLANEYKFAIVPRGSGTGLSGGSVPIEDSIILVTSHWNKILEFDEKNFTVLVEPGVITANLQSYVEDRNLFYPPDPGSSSISTLGGNVAENAGGLRGLKYGVTKNYVLGLEVVLPTGEIIFTGGKSIKDVAGYNLKDYFIGSEGTLGIFSKLLLKLIPLPESKKTILVEFSTIEDAINSINEIILSRITPSMLEFIDKLTLQCIEAYAKLGFSNSVETVILIEVDGNKFYVEESCEKIKEIVLKNNSLSFQISKDTAEELKLKKARKIAFSSLARVKPTAISEDVVVPRSELLKMVTQINSISKKHDVQIGTFGHAGDGNLHPIVLCDERDTKNLNNALRAVNDIFDASINLGGTITGEHGVGIAKREYLTKQISNPGIEMMRKIKKSIDPNSVLNPGKIFDLKPKCEGKLPSNQKQVEEYLAKDLWI